MARIPFRGGGGGTDDTTGGGTDTTDTGSRGLVDRVRDKVSELRGGGGGGTGGGDTGGDGIPESPREALQETRETQRDAAEQTPDVREAAPAGTDRALDRLQRRGRAQGRRGATTARGIAEFRQAEGETFGEGVDPVPESQDGDLLDPLQRGSPASETARDLVASGLGVAFQEPEQVAPIVGISRERVGDENVDIAGPAFSPHLETAQRENFAGRESTVVTGLQLFEMDELNTEVTDSLTRGRGFIDEEEEQEVLQRAETARELFGYESETEQTLEDLGVPDVIASGAGGVAAVPGEVAALPSTAAYALDVGVETGMNLPRTVGEYGFEETAGAMAGVGARATRQTIEAAEEDPAGFTGSLAGEAALGAVAGRALGTGSQFLRDRVRTAGATTYDLDSGDIVNPETGRYYDPADEFDDPEARFPGAEDPDLYETDPAEAVREQAEAYTPEAIEERFAEQGATEGSVLKKAIEVEPEGPGQGRARGFETQEGSYESPGGFAGPELSPNFLGIGDRGRSFSIRPGLPDLGDEATGVLVRTEVDEADATTMDEFSDELLDREGETTARTKPADEVNPGEIEAVIPPESEFADIGGGTGRSALRRLGVGSDFAVRVGGRDVPFTDVTLGGRRIPLRPVADPDLLDDSGGAGGISEFLADERGELGAAGDIDTGRTTRTLDEFRTPVQRGTDRPLPIVGGGGATEGSDGRTEPDDRRRDDLALPDERPVPSPDRDRASGAGSDDLLPSPGRDSPVPPSPGQPGGGSDDGTPPASESGPPAREGGPSTPTSPPGEPAPGSPGIPGVPSSPPTRPRGEDEPEEVEAEPLPDLFDLADEEFKSGIISGEEALEEAFGDDSDLFDNS